MAYIYQIINDVNGKIYIGKTDFSIEKRFKEHCRDSQKPAKEHRPLYSAMRKYGIEHFHIELLEETNNPEEREIYWIETKRSYKYGYNATIGGDGRKYIDYDLVIATYHALKSVKDTAFSLKIDERYVARILKENGTEVLSSQSVIKAKYGHIINQFTLDGKFIKSFSSAKEAAREIRPNTSSLGGVTSHITDVCKGKRQTAYGFKWQFA